MRQKYSSATVQWAKRINRRYEIQKQRTDLFREVQRIVREETRRRKNSCLPASLPGT